MTEHTPPPGLAIFDRHPLTVDQPPHWRASETAGGVFWATFAAALLALLAGCAFFGWVVLWIAALAVGSATAAGWLFSTLAKRPLQARHGGWAHTALMGLLLAMTLPASVRWYVPVIGGMAAAIIGRGLLGGLGHYLWQPALVGRLVVQALFWDQLAPAVGRVLDRHHAFLGQVGSATKAPAYDTWLTANAPGKLDGFVLPEPLGAFRDLVGGQAEWVRQTIAGMTSPGGTELGSIPGAVLFKLIWAHLPSLRDVAIGAVPGGVGATCAAALILAGLVLIYRGYVRWQMVVMFLLAAAATAAIAPLRIDGPNAANPSWHWLPGVLFYNSLAVGPMYVLFHVLNGELLLGAFFFAGDMGARPITVKGQVVFAAGCGVLAILIRLYAFAPGATFAAILLMNTLVPLIDRISQPRAFGR